MSNSKVENCKMQILIKLYSVRLYAGENALVRNCKNENNLTSKNTVKNFIHSEVVGVLLYLGVEAFQSIAVGCGNCSGQKCQLRQHRC